MMGSIEPDPIDLTPGAKRVQFKLNGWRRIGIVVTSVWIVTLSLIVFNEYSSGQIGFFVERKVIVDDKIFSSYQVEQFKLRYADERKKGIVKENHWDDWDIDFDKYPSVTEVHSPRLGIAISIPLIAWLFVEVAVLVILWVRRGFTRDSRSNGIRRD